MRLTNTFNGVDFLVNNEPRVGYSFYIGVSYNNISTHQLLNGVEFFVREGLMGRDIDCRIEQLQNLQNEFGEPKGFIYVSDSEVIRKTNLPYQTRPTAYVRVSFST